MWNCYYELLWYERFTLQLLASKINELVKQELFSAYLCDKIVFVPDICYNSFQLCWESSSLWLPLSQSGWRCDDCLLVYQESHQHKKTQAIVFLKEKNLHGSVIVKKKHVAKKCCVHYNYNLLQIICHVQHIIYSLPHVIYYLLQMICL